MDQNVFAYKVHKYTKNIFAICCLASSCLWIISAYALPESNEKRELIITLSSEACFFFGLSAGVFLYSERSIVNEINKGLKETFTGQGWNR
jgi:hypothetical protein